MPAPASDDADFERIPFNSSCPNCAISEAQPFAKIGAIYCISLREQPERAAKAIAHFHAIGLCQAVIMYRPKRRRFVTMAIWRSHRSLALHAGRHGHTTILVFEDDVSIDAPLSVIKARIAESLDRIPRDWWGLFLGHFPFQAYPVAPGLLRARSGCLHAYIANEPLLRWFRQTEPMDPAVSVSWLGDAVDSAISNLPGMYALTPMLATQRRNTDVNNIRPDTAADRRGGFSWALWRGWRDRMLVYSLMRMGAFVVTLIAPFHRATLERFRLRLDRNQFEARLVRGSGLFDDVWYLNKYPDIADAEVHPLAHYMRSGALEGRWPNPYFDSGYYFATHPELRRLKINPLVHYITRGAHEGSNPNPGFDSAAYLEFNRDTAHAGLNPLAQYLARNTAKS